MRLFKAQTGGTDQIRAALVSSPGLLGFLRPCYLHIAEPEDEWDANLSWHVKLWLDQITRRSSVNGWAPTFAFRHWRLHRIGLPCTSLWPCPSPSLGRLADKIIAGFQSNITWDFFLSFFFWLCLQSSTLEPVPECPVRFKWFISIQGSFFLITANCGSIEKWSFSHHGTSVLNKSKRVECLQIAEIGDSRGPNEGQNWRELKNRNFFKKLMKIRKLKEALQGP